MERIIGGSVLLVPAMLDIGWVTDRWPAFGFSGEDLGVRFSDELLRERTSVGASENAECDRGISCAS